MQLARAVAGEKSMRTCWIALVLTAGTGLISCNRDNHNTPEGRATARQAGRDAYRAAEAAKRDAKAAARQLEHASQDFRDGWEQAKHQSPPPEKESPFPPRHERENTQPRHR
jgi:hypothetical protein